MPDELLLVVLLWAAAELAARRAIRIAPLRRRQLPS
jgi:hypothetical protein